MKDKPHFFPNIVPGRFLERQNRFIARCLVDGKCVNAYLPNPGRLWELLFPGAVLYLVPHDAGFEGRTDFIVAAVERDGIPVMIHTQVNNLVARHLLDQGSIPGLEGASIVQQEKKYGASRFDFLLKKGASSVIVEIKSCTLAGNRLAMFPDAVTLRGTRHLQKLAALSRAGLQTAVIFLIHWPHAEYFLPEYHTDLVFAQTLLSVKDDVMVRAVSVAWTRQLEPGRVKEAVIPWHIVEREAHDRGSYIFVMRLRKNRTVAVGNLGETRFRKGYYLYVGSAREHLAKRLERHRRLIKKNHWHIDYLRQAADVHEVIPVRTKDDLECALAEALSTIADQRIDGFGSSDCRCRTHLFGMDNDPLHSHAFIKFLQHFRIDRLEPLLVPGEALSSQGAAGQRQRFS